LNPPPSITVWVGTIDLTDLALPMLSPVCQMI